MTKNRIITAVFFDFDNTLVDSYPIMVNALKNTFQHFSITGVTDEEIDVLMHGSLRDYFPDFFKENSDEATKIYYDNYLRLATKMEAFPNSEAVLKLLKQYKIPVAVVSNKGGEILRKEIHEHFKWSAYFDVIIGSKDTPEDKPSATPAIHAAKELKLGLCKNVWFIGDTITDISCATNAGCLPVLFKRDNIKFDYNKYNPELSINDHKETLELLKTILC